MGRHFGGQSSVYDEMMHDTVKEQVQKHKDKEKEIRKEAAALKKELSKGSRKKSR